MLGDDSPAHQAFLVMRGLTISSSALSCTTSSSITFQNVYLHNDGNTTGEVAFTGALSNPFVTWGSMGSFAGFEYNFDAPLPQAELTDINLSAVSLRFRAKSQARGEAAIIINGVGISTAGFTRSSATEVIEEWEDSATASFSTFISGVSLNANGADTSLDLLSLLGHTKVRSLLSQGKLNIAVAGDLYMRGINNTSARTVGVQVGGPELVLNGTYTVQVCNVPNDPNSPLREGGFVPPEPETVETCELVPEQIAGNQSTVVLNDGAGPAIGTIQVLDISSTTATIVWPTDEGSSTQVLYGITDSSTPTSLDATLTTFHQVQLSGLLPYKYYNFVVVSTDKYGNSTTSPEQRFRTLR